MIKKKKNCLNAYRDDDENDENVIASFLFFCYKAYGRNAAFFLKGILLQRERSRNPPAFTRTRSSFSVAFSLARSYCH